MTRLKRFLSRWPNRIALAIIGIFVFVALAAPLLAPTNPKDPVEGFQLAEDPKGYMPHPPSPGAPFGTVPSGTPNHQIDIFYTVVWGTRSALAFGLTVALLSTAFGVIVGATSAYLGGMVNNLTMRVTDAFMAFPVIVGVVFIQQLYLLSVTAAGGMIYHGGQALGSTIELPPEPSRLIGFLEQVNPVMLALILFSWMACARLTNTEVLRVKHTEYVLAAEAVGVRHSRIIFRHLIPNSIAPAIIIMMRDIGGVVLLQAALTFIGMGGESLWGELLVLSRRWIIGPGGNFLTYWWTYLPVTLAIILFGIGWNLLGDGLNDWFNPRSTQRFD